MRCLTGLILAMVVVAATCICTSEVWAKGGRGGFKGGGGGGFNRGGSAPGKGGGNRGGSFQRGNQSRPGKTQSGGSRKPTFDRSVRRGATTDNLTGGNQPWSKDHAREQRKLDHRKQVADRLRKISEQNGNEHLKQVADDMDQRAQSHYDKQMEKIKQKYGLDDEDVATGDAGDADEVANELADAATDADDATNGPGGALDNADDALSDEARKLTGRENALYRQLRNEERKLAQRMEAVERMRQLAEQAGDDGMLQAADQLEDWAISHFDQRMAQITDFQQRHDLPDVSEFFSP